MGLESENARHEMEQVCRRGRRSDPDPLFLDIYPDTTGSAFSSTNDQDSLALRCAFLLFAAAAALPMLHAPPDLLLRRTSSAVFDPPIHTTTQTHPASPAPSPDNPPTSSEQERTSSCVVGVSLWG